MSFFEQISDALNSLRLQWSEVATRADIDPSVLYKWQAGEHQPRKSTRWRIEDAMGIDFIIEGGDVVGWKVRSDVEPAQEGMTGTGGTGRAPRKLAEDAISRIEVLARAAMDRYSISSTTNEGTMTDERIALYEALYRELALSVERVRRKAEAEIEDLVLEFEQKIARHDLTTISSKINKKGSSTHETQ